MSPVKNQAYRGTCSAFATIALLEYGERQNLRLSEQHLVLNSTSEDPGWTIERLRWAETNGFLLETDAQHGCQYHSYSRVQSKCDYPQTSKLFTLPGRIQESHVSWGKQEEEVIRLISEGHPVAIGAKVTGDWNDKRRLHFPFTTFNCNKLSDLNERNQCLTLRLSDGFYDDRKKSEIKKMVCMISESSDWCKNFDLYFEGNRPMTPYSDLALSGGEPVSYQTGAYGEIKSVKTSGHAFVITGYDLENRFFEFKNSWGANWGDGGYGYLSFEYFKELSMDSMYWIDDHNPYLFKIDFNGSSSAIRGSNGRYWTIQMNDELLSGYPYFEDQPKPDHGGWQTGLTFETLLNLANVAIEYSPKSLWKTGGFQWQGAWESFYIETIDEPKKLLQFKSVLGPLYLRSLASTVFTGPARPSVQFLPSRETVFRWEEKSNGWGYLYDSSGRRVKQDQNGISLVWQ